MKRYKILRIIILTFKGKFITCKFVHVFCDNEELD